MGVRHDDPKVKSVGQGGAAKGKRPKSGKKEPPPPPPPVEDPERDLLYGHIWRPPAREFVVTHDTALSHVQDTSAWRMFRRS